MKNSIAISNISFPETKRNCLLFKDPKGLTAFIQPTIMTLVLRTMCCSSNRDADGLSLGIRNVNVGALNQTKALGKAIVVGVSLNDRMFSFPLSQISCQLSFHRVNLQTAHLYHPTVGEDPSLRLPVKLSSGFLEAPSLTPASTSPFSIYALPGFHGNGHSI